MHLPVGGMSRETCKFFPESCRTAPQEEKIPAGELVPGGCADGRFRSGQTVQLFIEFFYGGVVHQSIGILLGFGYFHNAVKDV